MRIENNIKIVSSYDANSVDNTAKTASERVKAYSSDRIEVRSDTSIEDIEKKIEKNVLIAENKRLSAEKLEYIQNQISRKEYFISTEDIVNSIFK